MHTCHCTYLCVCVYVVVEFLLSSPIKLNYVAIAGRPAKGDRSLRLHCKEQCMNMFNCCVAYADNVDSVNTPHYRTQLLSPHSTLTLPTVYIHTYTHKNNQQVLHLSNELDTLT